MRAGGRAGGRARVCACARACVRVRVLGRWVVGWVCVRACVRARVIYCTCAQVDCVCIFLLVSQFPFVFDPYISISLHFLVFFRTGHRELSS